MTKYLQLSRHVGNQSLFDCVEMAVISSMWGVPFHLHAEGLRGTGKTTIFRAAKDIFPKITRIKGCQYNCDPNKPHCPLHKEMSQGTIAQIGTEQVPMPFLEISHSAKIGTVVGSIDLAKITDPNNPVAAILPGLIPQAHRGIIFVDEINRLADTSPELTDILLDLMGTKPGRVQIEETGLPVVDIPVQVSVWAASNPDEEPGPLQEIRRQLSDRFDLVIDMGRTHESETIAEILKHNCHVRFREQTTQNFDSSVANEKYSLKLAQRASKYLNLDMPDYLRNFIARIYVKYDLESIRAIGAIQHAALLNCAIRNGETVLISDIFKVIPLALHHRVDSEILTRIMNSNSDFNIVKDKIVETVQHHDLDQIEPSQRCYSSGSVPKEKSKSFMEPVLGFFGIKNERENALKQESTLVDHGKDGGQRITELKMSELITPEQRMIR